MQPEELASFMCASRDTQDCSSLTPLVTSWTMEVPQPDLDLFHPRGNSDASSDILLDFLSEYSPQQDSMVEEDKRPCSCGAYQQQQACHCAQQAGFDSPFPFNFDTWSKLCVTDELLTSGSPIEDEQQEGKLLQKRKGGNNCKPAAPKRRSGTTQSVDKTKLISNVIASLPAAVLQEHQRAIPTAFPSRMRQTRVQAAIKAQTDAMVQNCQQRILSLRNTNGVSTPGSTDQPTEGDGQKVQYIGAYTVEERRLRVARFHEKRKHRVWFRTVKYNCRRKLAVGRTRVKGRFVKTDQQEDMMSLHN